MEDCSLPGRIQWELTLAVSTECQTLHKGFCHFSCPQPLGTLTCWPPLSEAHSLASWPCQLLSILSVILSGLQQVTVSLLCHTTDNRCCVPRSPWRTYKRLMENQVCDPLMTTTSKRGDGFEERIFLDSTVFMEVMGMAFLPGGFGLWLWWTGI